MLNQDALALMRRTARKLGYRVKPNSRQDWSCYQGKHWRGIIVVIESEFDKSSPFAVCIRHNNFSELDDLRHAMNCALADAGYLEYAEHSK